LPVQTVSSQVLRIDGATARRALELELVQVLNQLALLLLRQKARMIEQFTILRESCHGLRALSSLM